jgi:hypothetical protein
MSQHLWMYGELLNILLIFQINQGLIDEEDYYSRLSDQIARSRTMNDTMSFTTMSANVLEQPYKDQYINVYQKKLLGCVLTSLSEKKVMAKEIFRFNAKAFNEFGVSKAFNDNELLTK